MAAVNPRCEANLFLEDSSTYQLNESTLYIALRGLIYSFGEENSVELLWYSYWGLCTSRPQATQMPCLLFKQLSFLLSHLEGLGIKFRKQRSEVYVCLYHLKTYFYYFKSCVSMYLHVEMCLCTQFSWRSESFSSRPWSWRYRWLRSIWHECWEPNPELVSHLSSPISDIYKECRSILSNFLAENTANMAIMLRW